MYAIVTKPDALIAAVDDFVKNYEAHSVSQQQSVKIIRLTNKLQERIRETIIFNSIHEKVTAHDEAHEFPQTYRELKPISRLIETSPEREPKTSEDSPEESLKKLRQFQPLTSAFLSSSKKHRESVQAVKSKTKRMTNTNLCSPQVGKRFQISSRAMDPVFSLNLLPSEELEKAEQKLIQYQERANLSQEELAKKLQELNTLDLKLYKVQKDCSKLARDLEETEAKLTERQSELIDFSKKEFELKLEIDIAKNKLGVVDDLLNKVRETNLAQFYTSKINMEKLIKEHYDNLLLLRTESDKLKEVDRVAEYLIQLLADPEREILSSDYLEACLKKPEEIIANFFENNYQTISEIVERQTNSRAGGLHSSKPQSENASSRHSEDKATAKDSPLGSIRRLAQNYFSLKKPLVRADSKAKHQLITFSRGSPMERDSIVPPLNLKPFSGQSGKLRLVMDPSTGQHEDIRHGRLEQRRSKANLFQSGLSNADKLARPHSAMFHLDDSVMFEKDPALNESNLDQSYLVIIENVFTLLDSLFQRIKSHVKVVYDECINSVDELESEVESSFCDKLKSNLFNLEKRYNFAKIDLAELKGGRSKNIGDICFYIQRMIEFLQDEQDEFISSSVHQEN